MHRCSILPVITANKDTNYNHLVSQLLYFCCKHRLAQKVAAMYYTCTKHSNSTQCDADIANNCQWTDSINDGMCISNPNSVWEELLVCPGSVVSAVQRPVAGYTSAVHSYQVLHTQRDYICLGTLAAASGAHHPSHEA
jgi:hypothetical protein